jgi:cold-inducible RNA-binding protein
LIFEMIVCVWRESGDSARLLDYCLTSLHGRSSGERRSLVVWNPIPGNGSVAPSFSNFQNTMKLYVGNLAFETTENDLQDLFEQHGAVNEVNLMMDRMTGKSRGFAFVTMNDNGQAKAAMTATNGKELNGRALNVNEARPREERPRPNGSRRSFSGFRR